MVVRTVAERFPAKVEVITAVKEGSYGPYRSVLFKRTDIQGEGAKVWRAMNPSEAEQFSKGQQVYLVPTTNKKGNPSWDIELLPEVASASKSPSTATQVIESQIAQQKPQESGLTSEQKTAIAEYVRGQADLLAYCWTVAESKLPDKSEESHRCAASTLFISAQRKFSL